MSSSTSIISKLIHGPASRPVIWVVVNLLVTVTLSSVVLFLGITPAWSGTPTERSITVSFRDLDLSSPKDANELYRRIQSAARQVCGYVGADLIEQSLWRGCYRNTVTDAVGKVNNPLLTAIHTGHPAPMTAMLRN